MVDLECCQKHRLIYDKKYEKIDEDILQTLSPTASVSNTEDDVTSKSLLSESVSNMEGQEKKPGVMRKTLYMSPQMKLAKKMLDDKKKLDDKIKALFLANKKDSFRSK